MGVLVRTRHNVRNVTPSTIPSEPWSGLPLRFCQWQVITSLTLSVAMFGLTVFLTVGNPFTPLAIGHNENAVLACSPTLFYGIYILYLGALALTCGIICAKGYTRYKLFLKSYVLSLVRGALMLCPLLDEIPLKGGNIPILLLTLGPFLQVVVVTQVVELGFVCYFLHFSYQGMLGYPEKPKVSELTEIVVES